MRGMNRKTCTTAITATTDCTDAAALEITDFYTDDTEPETYLFCADHAPTSLLPEHDTVALKIIRYL